MTAALLSSSTAMPIALISWKPMVKGALRGFCTIRLGRSLVVHDVCVLASNGKLWASLPSKPQVGSDGTVLRTDAGKTKYVPVLEWADRDAGDRFSASVIAAVREQYGIESLEPSA